MGRLIGNLIKAAILVAGIYVIVKWAPIAVQPDESAEFAEKACRDETAARFNVSTMRVYDVSKTNIGYTVRITVTLTRGTPAKVVCLTNTHGGVRDILLDQR